jgi:hypothetical protein
MTNSTNLIKVRQYTELKLPQNAVVILSEFQNGWSGVDFDAYIDEVVSYGKSHPDSRIYLISTVDKFAPRSAITQTRRGLARLKAAKLNLGKMFLVSENFFVQTLGELVINLHAFKAEVVSELSDALQRVEQETAND